MKTDQPLLHGVMRSFAAAALIAGASGDAMAQSFPTRPVRMIVPYPAGGGTDIISRTVAQKLGEKWGQQVIVDNRAGANGIIGTDLAAKSKPDGYTLVVVIATQAINPALYPKIPYNSETDFAPVSLMAQYPFILTTHPSIPAKSVREFIALAKKRPGELSYASSGNGSGPHLGFELFKSMAGINVVHIPYKGAGPANTELISGQVQAFFNNILAGKPHIQSGRLRVIAATSAKRSQAMPEIPTFAESGVPGFDVTGWYALLAPAGTPASIVNKVQSDTTASLRIPDVAARLSSEGAEPVGSSPEVLTKFLQTETQKWAKVVKVANIKID
jgi:tripartite-type tricarboxylate transporter receptor subunit TctC